MNRSDINNELLDCDKLAISIIDRICKPINHQVKKNEELRTLASVFNFMGIGIKDEMKKELYKNPKLFKYQYVNGIEMNYGLGSDESTHRDINTDIIRFSECIKSKGSVGMRM